ncbi:MAG: glycosyltransferase [Paludibacteraceae bacterium]
MNDKKLHILHLPSWYLPEGGQFCRNQVQALNETGEVYASILANVTISTRKYGLKSFLFPKNFFLSHEDDMDVFRNYHISLPRLKKRDALNWSKETLKMIESYFKQFGKPDLIHVHSVLWAGYAAKLVKEKYEIPYIITEHRGIFGLSCNWGKNQFLEWEDDYRQQAYSNADLIIPVSEKLIPKISTYLNKPVPVKVVSNMIDTEFFHYKPRAKTNKIQAVMVNGLSYSKGYDILFPAAGIALDTVENLEINIVGEDFSGKEFDKLWEKVKHKSRILLSGEKDSHGVREALWNADFYIISSRVEAQPVSTLEALSTGLPIVCTEVIPETMANETNSIRVPVEDVEKLAAAIMEMSKRFADFDRKKISENIKKTADKKVVARKLIEAYRDILSQ